jgi:hypothetical protein
MGCRSPNHLGRKSPHDWLSRRLVALKGSGGKAAIAHDIGYVRGVVKGDKDDGYVVDGGGRKISLPRGSSDAALAPYHVERSKLFVLDRRWIRVRANMNLGAYASPECFAPRNVLHGRAVVPWLPPVVVAIKRAECGVP